MLFSRGKEMILFEMDFRLICIDQIRKDCIPVCFVQSIMYNCILVMCVRIYISPRCTNCNILFINNYLTSKCFYFYEIGV